MRVPTVTRPLEHFIAKPMGRLGADGPSCQPGEKPISNATFTLMGLGVGAILVVWLVFSVFKKILGLLFLVALAFGAWTLWNNPALLQQVLGSLPLP